MSVEEYHKLIGHKKKTQGQMMTVAAYHKATAKKKSHGSHTPRVMNATEAQYATFLEHGRRSGGVKEWAHEPVKVRLEDGSLYTPDFFELDWNDKREFVEVKAAWRVEQSKFHYKPHWEGDARIKFKWGRVRLMKLFGIPLVAVWFHPYHRTWEREEL